MAYCGQLENSAGYQIRILGLLDVVKPKMTFCLV